jgi:putative flippase GtrA
VVVKASQVVLARMGVTPRLLLKELGAFGLVGGLAFLLDVGVFQVLYSHGVGAVTAKLVSTVVATAAAYLGNKFWSFSHRAQKPIRHEVLVFAAINAVTGALNLGIVALVRYVLHQDSTEILQAANVFGIGAGTLIRYASYRRWVFTAAADDDAAPQRLEEPVRIGTVPAAAPGIRRAS